MSNPVITNKRTLQRRLEKEFGTDISFDVKQFTMVYASDTKPCDYDVAALHGCGLRDDDFVRTFGRRIKRKIMIKKEREEKWPLTPEELLASFDEGPLPELYNARVLTLKSWKSWKSWKCPCFFCVLEFCTGNGYFWRNVLELSWIIAKLFLLILLLITFMKYFHSLVLPSQIHFKCPGLILPNILY